MNKTIYIGELALNVSLCADGHADTGVGDWAVNAAVLDGQMGLPTIWVGEAADGTVGDHMQGEAPLTGFRESVYFFSTLNFQSCPGLYVISGKSLRQLFQENKNSIGNSLWNHDRNRW
ncbi:hypothetical protein [uncultured Duncaniella sp.]|jgi:hypothetical protein|uniref:hypothetical protein n=1 Tax=uncultured Duncaniella sp. TaxID=2768039 RepID=UPI0025B1F134|nr:hypothetical protein [uncultured Duncaniella sp.]